MSVTLSAHSSSASLRTTHWQTSWWIRSGCANEWCNLSACRHRSWSAYASFSGNHWCLHKGHTEMNADEAAHRWHQHQQNEMLLQRIKMLEEKVAMLLHKITELERRYEWIVTGNHGRRGTTLVLLLLWSTKVRVCLLPGEPLHRVPILWWRNTTWNCKGDSQCLTTPPAHFLAVLKTHFQRNTWTGTSLKGRTTQPHISVIILSCLA